MEMYRPTERGRPKAPRSGRWRPRPATDEVIPRLFRVFDLVPAGKADHRGVLAKIERREKPGGNVLPEYALLPSLPRI